ncbi:MAG: hypothetical protein K2L67_04150 [Clostridia bacterium]|nr:hypothetical protein [Clostridia bacterium]
MDKIKNFFLNFINTRKIAYYIAAAITLIAWIAGIVASGALGFAGATALPAVLVTLGLILFVATSVVGHEKIGVALVAAASYGALVAMFCEVFAHFLSEIEGQGMTGFNIASIQGVGALIACVIMLVVCAVAANVLALLKLSKETKPENTQKEEVNNTEAATDEVN